MQIYIKYNNVYFNFYVMNGGPLIELKKYPLCFNEYSECFNEILIMLLTL